MILGAVALIAGINACDKDDDDGMECCTLTEKDGSITYKWKACEDGSVTYSYTGGPTETYSWKDEYSSWSEVKELFLEDGGTCD